MSSSLGEPQLMKIRRWMLLLTALLGCTGMQRSRPVLHIEYRSEDGVIRVYNRTRTAIRIYYGDVRSYYENQMIFARFRDRDSKILGLGHHGWFMPAIYSSQIYREPRRISMAIPAGSFIDLRWELARFASAVNRDAALSSGPCDVQIGLIGYLDSDGSNRIEAHTGWMRGPCPGYTNAGNTNSGHRELNPAGR